MSYSAAFRRLVIEPLKNHVDTTLLLKQIKEDPKLSVIGFDTYLRVNILEQGQAACDTEIKVLQSCYTYQDQHIAAYRKVIGLSNQPAIIDNLEGITIFDFGCGPLTAAIAIAEETRVSKGDLGPIRYVGFDNQRFVRNKASDFADADGIYPVGSNFILMSSWNECSDEQIKEVSAPGSTLIFSFSYFFGQANLTDADVMEIIHFTKRVYGLLASKCFYIIYINPPDVTGRAFGDKFKLYYSQFINNMAEPISASYDFSAWRDMLNRTYIRNRPMKYCVTKVTVSE